MVWIVGGVLALLILGGVWLALVKKPGGAPLAVVAPDEAGAQPYPFVHVNSDGTARELHPEERRFLETPFQMSDAGRPYVKPSYPGKNGWGDLAGYLRRASLPAHVAVQPAPADSPIKPLTAEGMVEFLQSKGLHVTRDGGKEFTVTRPE